MSSRSELEVKSRLVLGLGLLSIGLVWLLKLLWPVLVIAGMGAGGYYLWRQQYRKYQAYQRRQDRLTEKFYYLLQQRQGRMSALEFAMHTRVDGRDAQRFLHSQAQAFGAFFERTVHGDIIYIFNLAVVFSLEPSYAPPAYRPVTPAEVAWAYAEQAQVKRAYVEDMRRRQREGQRKGESGRSLRPSAEKILPTVRGRAQATAENVKTIDVSAVNE
ncbi:MAG: hypothetical protein ACFB16_04130 [Phormidesmis sp.]